jgi:2-keto-4-pentenoate hydratase
MTVSPAALHHALADALLLAELRREPLAPLSATRPELTVQDAYAIQAVDAASLAATHGGVAGHKIGLTSRAMQEMLGVDEPDYGHLYGDRVHRTGTTIDASALIAPRIEPEIAFVLGAPLSGPGVTPDDVLAATAHVVPALEVIDSRIADWKIALVDTIADNASCASVILGARRTAPATVDLAAAAVELRVDGQTVQQGTGAAVLGHPARAIAWLANALGRFGVGLEPGQVLMPGSLTAAVALEPGTVVRADFGPLGDVEARVAPTSARRA